MTIFNTPESCDYSIVANLFIDLRGKGISLSSADLEVLLNWENASIKPNLVMQIMLEYAEECKKKGRDFPNTLAPISRRLHSILIKSSEA